eukprot:14651819-Ditylum_brightwellii.AAC.1
MGGHEGRSRLLLVEAYCPTSGQWTSLLPMQTKCSGCAAVSMGGNLYVMGGHDGSRYLLSVEVYSPTAGKWS